MKKHIPWKTVQYSSLLLQVLMVFPIASVSFLFVSKVNQSIGFGKKTKEPSIYESHNIPHNSQSFFSIILFEFCCLFLFSSFEALSL